MLEVRLIQIAHTSERNTGIQPPQTVSAFNVYAEEQSILTTLLKQRRESVESFTKGNRPELAAKEQIEIGLIDAYMPQAAGEDEIRAVVQGAIEHVTKDAGGTRPGPRDMGTIMKVVQQRLLADGIRADGKVVSEMVKAELAKS